MSQILHAYSNQYLKRSIYGFHSTAGDKNPIIAQKLYIREGTVKTHVRNTLKKLGVNDPCGICEAARTQAAIRVLRSSLAY